jgi:hypothetical protein
MSGALIKADGERRLAFVEVVSDEAGDENFIYFVLDLSRPQGPTLPVNLCGFNHDAIREFTDAARRLGPRY